MNKDEAREAAWTRLKINEWRLKLRSTTQQRKAAELFDAMFDADDRFLADFSCGINSAGAYAQANAVGYEVEAILNDHVTLTARIEELEAEVARLQATLDGDPNQTETPETRLLWRQSAIRTADRLEAENKRLREALDTIRKRIMGYEPDNRIEARFFGELKIIANKALEGVTE